MSLLRAETWAHIAVALARYIPEAKREVRGKGGYWSPAVQIELDKVLAFVRINASMRQEATPLATPTAMTHGGAMTDGLLLTKRQAAAVLAVSVRQLERLVADPGVDLHLVRVGGAVRVRRSDLEHYVAGLATKPGGTFRNNLTSKETA